MRLTPNQLKFALLPLAMKTVLKYRLCRYVGFKYFGLNELDRKLIEVIGDSTGYFIEIGANDGFTGSNTKHLELFHNWQGILIDPIPEQIQRCRLHRRSSTHTFQAACVSFEYQEATIELLYSDTMTIALSGESDIEDRHEHAHTGEQFLSADKEVYSFRANARTMTSILDEANAPYVIDLLSLDVEGGELEVLKGIDHTRYRFNWILVESRSLDVLTGYLTTYEYKLSRKLGEHDFLFKTATSPL